MTIIHATYCIFAEFSTNSYANAIISERGEVNKTIFLEMIKKNSFVLNSDCFFFSSFFYFPLSIHVWWWFRYQFEGLTFKLFLLLPFFAILISWIWKISIFSRKKTNCMELKILDFFCIRDFSLLISIIFRLLISVTHTVSNSFVLNYWHFHLAHFGFVSFVNTAMQCSMMIINEGLFFPRFDYLNPPLVQWRGIFRSLFLSLWISMLWKYSRKKLSGNLLKKN